MLIVQYDTALSSRGFESPPNSRFSSLTILQNLSKPPAPPQPLFTIRGPLFYPHSTFLSYLIPFLPVTSNIISMPPNSNGTKYHLSERAGPLREHESQACMYALLMLTKRITVEF